MRAGAERARDARRAPTRDDAGETRGAVDASAREDDIAIDRARVRDDGVARETYTARGSDDDETFRNLSTTRALDTSTPPSRSSPLARATTHARGDSRSNRARARGAAMRRRVDDDAR
jgi:hypothetical protein